MKDIIKIVLCEGAHDVAFINKILKTNGFFSYESIKANELPFPINNLVVNEAKKSNVEDLNIQELRHTLLPSNALHKDSQYIFLYSIGGDGKKAIRQNLLNRLLSYIPKDGEIIGERKEMENVDLKIIYSFDSDQKGIINRLREIEKEIQEVVLSFTLNTLNANYSSVKNEGITFGCQIFTGNDNNTGKLEDIMVPIMRLGNESIFDSAAEFLSKHFDENRLFPLKIEVSSTGIKEVRSIKNKDKHKYDEYKSIVATVGQLQKSGMANTVCIAQTDYLEKHKIDSNAKCQDIIKFINTI